jgi:hypothetical protein
MEGITLTLFRIFYYQALIGRYISIEQPMLGRFSKRHLKEIYRKIGGEINTILIKSNFKTV